VLEDGLDRATFDQQREHHPATATAVALEHLLTEHAAQQLSPGQSGIGLAVGLADGTTREIQSPMLNSVKGSIEIQQVIENSEWVGQPGSPVAYAPHLRKSPLAGMLAKSVIYQFAKGDQSVPNPNTTAVLRAGGLADRATFYRHDVALAEASRTDNQRSVTSWCL